MTAPFFIQIYFNSKKALRYLLFSCHRLGIFEPIYFADYFTWTSITRHWWSENMMLEPLIISARTFLVITPSCPALITNNATQRRRNILIPSITHHRVREFEFQFNTNGRVTKTSESGPSSHLTPGQMWSSFDRWVLYHKIWADFIFLSPFRHCVGSWLVTTSDSLRRVEASLSVTWSQCESCYCLDQVMKTVTPCSWHRDRPAQCHVTTV